MNTLISVMILGSTLALLASAIKHVPAGQVYSLHRLGKPARLLQPGVHMVMPLLERVAHKINLAGQVLRLEESMADSAHDVRGTVYGQVLGPERADAVIDQVDQLIRRGAIAAMHDEPQAGEAADRRVLGTRMKLALNSALRERGMMVTRVDLDLA